jgi:ABC-2 type transport system permease protein
VGGEAVATLPLTCGFLRGPPEGASAIATSTDFTERTSEPPHLRVRPRLRELLVFREVLWNLVRKELKVKYTASVLGAVWSLLNPVVFLAVFSFVANVLGAAVQDYPVFLLAGLLAWNLFSTSLSVGAQSVVANGNLVKKVYFPREILPLATVGVALTDFLLQSTVYFLFLIVFPFGHPYGFDPGTLWLYPIAFVAVLVVTVGITLWVSSMNVRYRDIQHLLNLALLVWFWLTPIVYPGGLVQEKLSTYTLGGVSAWDVFLLNPMAWVVFGFQRALYHSADAAARLPSFTTGQLALGLLGVIAVGSILLWLTWRSFFAMSGDFAEEL